MNIYFTTRRSDKKIHRYIEDHQNTLCGLKGALSICSLPRTLNLPLCKICDKKAKAIVPQVQLTKAIVPQVQPPRDYPKIVQITGSLSMVYGLDESGDLWRAFNANKDAKLENETILSWELCILKNKPRRKEK